MNLFGYAVRLLKSSCQDGCQDDGKCFYSFGYYNYIHFIPLRSLSHTAQRCEEDELTPKQEIIFVDLPGHAEESLESFHDKLSKSGLCCVSFLLFEESRGSFVSAESFKDQVEALRFASGKILKKLDAKLDIHFFTTLGASCVALMILPENSEDPGNFYNSALAFLRDFRLADISGSYKGPVLRMIYSFSVLCFHRCLLEEERLRLFHDIRIDHVQVYMLANPNRDILDYAREIRDRLEGPDDAQKASLILLAGTDDYLLTLKHVRLEEIFRLYKAGDLLGRKTCCNSVYLSLGKDVNLNQALGYTGASLSDWDAEAESGDYDIYALVKSQIDLLANSGKPALARMLEGLIQNYRCLCESYYTTWFCPVYREVIRFFAHIIVESVCIYKEELKNISEYTKEFVSMFEHLSFKNALSTDSPGFHMLQDDFSPRMILAYNVRFNELLKAWNGFNNNLPGKARRTLHGTSVIEPGQHGEIQGEHLSFFTMDSLGDQLSMVMFNQNCPPGKRLLIITMSTNVACRPYIALPGILHETGHVIGPRRRLARADYFLKTVANLLCRALCMGNSAFSWHATPFPFNGDQKESEEYNFVLSQVVYANRDSLYNILAERFCVRYREKQEWIRVHTTETGKQEKLIALAYCYGEDLQALAGLALQDLLQRNPHMAELMINQFTHFLKEKGHKPSALDKIHSELTRRWELLYLRTNRAISAAVDLGYALFSELAADMFMFKVTRMNMGQYLQFCFLLFRNLGVPLSQIYSQQIELTRLFLMLDTCFAHPISFDIEDFGMLQEIRDNYLNEYRQFLYDLEKMYAFYQERRAEEFGVWNMCMSFDPLHDYMQELKTDPRWLEDDTLAGADYQEPGFVQKRENFKNVRDDMASLFESAWKMGLDESDLAQQRGFLLQFIFHPQK
jgi:hypothetical protein